MPLWPKRLKKGEQITEAWIDSLISAIEAVIRPQAPLKFERTRKGVLLMLDGGEDGFGVAIGVVAAGGISARVGMVAGTGDVSLLRFTPPNFTSGTGVRKVWNIASAVPVGKWVIIMKIYGFWFVIKVVC